MALAEVFSYEFCEIFKNTFYTEHLREPASEYSLFYSLALIIKKTYFTWLRKILYWSRLIVCQIFNITMFSWRFSQFFELSMFINVSLPWIYYLMKCVGDSDMQKKTFCLIPLVSFFKKKNYYWWVKSMT